MADNLDSHNLNDKELKKPLEVQRFEFEKTKELRDEAREDRRFRAERKGR